MLYPEYISYISDSAIAMQPKKRESDKSNADAPPAKMNRTASDFESLDFSSAAETKDGKKWNFKISTWNVDGLRAWIKKGGLDFLKHEKPDVLCLQETKLLRGDRSSLEIKFPNFCFFYNYSSPNGQDDLRHLRGGTLVMVGGLSGRSMPSIR